jgi:next-to-BRCA1 protein 1
MKAPARDGTAISYWRLKTAEGLPFGHRLWCDIQVVTPPVQPAPAAGPAEASSSTATITPYERFQQAKMERFRALRLAQSQAQSARFERAKAESERTGRMQDEALERLKKIGHSDETPTRLVEKIEREKLLRAQRVRKVAIDRLLESRRKEHEAYTALQQQEIQQQEKTVEAPVTETAELPSFKEASEETKKELQSSGMIFPQLDNESPASSTHEAVIAQPSPRPDEPSAPASVAENSDEEFFEDAESVEIRSLSSDDGFMTDEEYDILDASDEEMP